MPKKKKTINTLQGKRLKQLLAEEGITQKQLHKEIHTSQQYISEIINGKAHLNYSMADSISKLPRFKSYDLLEEWLLCEEDFKSNTEKLLNAVATAQYENDKLLQGLGCFLLLADYNIDISYPDKLSFDTAKSIKNIAPDFFPTYTIKKDNQLIAELSAEEMNVLGNKLFRLFEVYIKDYFE